VQQWLQRNKPTRVETQYFAARRDQETGNIDGLSPIFCRVGDFMNQIRGTLIDPDQTEAEKLNWIRLPATA
jgi:hypothetical protein